MKGVNYFNKIQDILLTYGVHCHHFFGVAFSYATAAGGNAIGKVLSPLRFNLTPVSACGNYGNNPERRKKLGDRYQEIQSKVNEMYRNGEVR